MAAELKAQMSRPSDVSQPSQLISVNSSVLTPPFESIAATQQQELPFLPVVNPHKAARPSTGETPMPSWHAATLRQAGADHPLRAFVSDEVLPQRCPVLRLLLFLAMHVLMLVAEGLAMYIVASSTLPASLSSILLTSVLGVVLLYVAGFCMWVAWNSPAQVCGAILPLKNRSCFMALPLLPFLGFLQGVVVILAVDEFKQLRDPANSTAVTASRYHIKALMGVAEGLVTAAVLTCHWLHNFTHPPQRHGEKYYTTGGEFIYMFLVSVCYLSAILGLLEVDFCVSKGMQDVLQKWYGRPYVFMHFLYRTSEAFSRTLMLYICFLEEFWALIAWEALITVAVIYFYCGAETTWSARILCCWPTFFANIFESIDAPTKRRAAWRVSWRLTLRNVLSPFLMITFLTCAGKGLPCNKKRFIHAWICNVHEFAKAPWSDWLGKPLIMFLSIYLILLTCMRTCSCGIKDIFTACEQGRLEEAEAALGGSDGDNRGVVHVNINSMDVDGQTPLMLAAANGHDEVCIHLLNLGARTDARVSEDTRILVKWFNRPVRDRWTALHMAAQGGHVEVVQALLGFPGMENKPAWAKRVEAEVCVPGRTSSYHDRLLNTPLHIAARAGHAEVVRLMVKACPHWREELNQDGRRPLELARKEEVVAAMALGETRAGQSAAPSDEVEFTVPSATPSRPESGSSRHFGSVLRHGSVSALGRSRMSQDIDSWQVTQLTVVRSSLDMKAPGLCSFIAGSCGGALRRYYLVRDERVAPVPTYVPGGSDISLGGSSFNIGAMTAFEQGLFDSLEPVDKNGESLPIWSAMTEGLQTYGERISYLTESGFPKPSRLGTGSYGSVFRTRSRTSQSLYALKLIPLKKSRTLSQLAHNECRVFEAVNVNLHPCLVKLWGIHYEPNRDLLSMLMEYCQNGDLKGRIQQVRQEARQAQVPYQAPARALLWIGQIFLALEHLHERKRALLRDLKPDNVVLTQGDRAKLTDFGLGRFGVEHDGCQTFGFPAGSPGYIAPEVLSRKPYDFRADLYSFGVLVWVLLTGGVRRRDEPGPPMCENRDPNLHVDDYKLLHRCLDHAQANDAGALDDTAKDFVYRLTRGKSAKRLLHEDVRQHPLLRHLELPSFTSSSQTVEAWLLSHEDGP